MPASRSVNGTPSGIASFAVLGLGDPRAFDLAEKTPNPNFDCRELRRLSMAHDRSILQEGFRQMERAGPVWLDDRVR